MLDSIRFKVRFSEPISKNIPTTPGGFQFTKSNGDEVRFDFENSLTERDGVYTTFTMDTLDLNVYEGSEKITVQDILEMKCFDDIFIDMDEVPGKVNVEDIIFFEMTFFENKHLIRVSLNHDILKNYLKGCGEYD